MPQYSYTAKQGPQKTLEGSIEAENLDAAIKKIQRAGFIPIEIRKQERAAPSGYRARFLKNLISLPQRVPSSEVTTFTQQMSDLIDAGIPVLRALGNVRKQIRHPYFKNVLNQVSASVKDGSMFSEALGRFPNIFPAVYVNIIKSGELSGNLPAVLKRLSKFTTQDEETRAQIRASLVYPALILSVGTLTIFVLLTWVIPRLTSIFDDLNASLPLPTKILLFVSNFLANYWWLVILIVCLLLLFLQDLWNSPNGKLWLDKVRLKLPGIGSFYRNAEIARFSRTLGMLLENGVPIVTALESVLLVMENAEFKRATRDIITSVTNGKNLTESLEQSSFFPETVIQMIAVGEETGQPAQGLEKLAEYYEQQVQRFMKSMASLIEPALILVLGTVIGSVVLAMLLPLFRMDLLIH